MAMTNSKQRYGGVAKGFHWLTALLILTLIPLGLYAHQLPHDTAEQLARKAWLFSLHKTVGVTVFFTALLRILWAITQEKPRLLHPDRKLERQLRDEYETQIGTLVARLNDRNYQASLKLAQVPDEIRGFGLVKEQAAKAAREQSEQLLAEIDGLSA